jgi:hypothetical protein
MFSEHRPPRALGALIGGALAAWCFLLMGLLLWRGLTLDIDLAAVFLYIVSGVFLGLGLLFAYWTYGCLTLKYHLDRNGLTIHWGDIRQFIPMDRIERLVPGRELPAPKVTGLSWIGHHIGHARVEGLGDVVVYSTHGGHDDLLYVVTAAQTYAITVEDEVRFAEELQGHQKMGQMVSLPQVAERTSLAALRFWHDPYAVSLAMAAIAGFAVMLSYVFYSYPDLSQTIEIPFPEMQGITRVEDKEELLAIPMTGVGLLAVNLVLGFALHAWERAVGYMLFLAGLSAQIILLAAAIIVLADN